MWNHELRKLSHMDVINKICQEAEQKKHHSGAAHILKWIESSHITYINSETIFFVGHDVITCG